MKKTIIIVSILALILGLQACNNETSKVSATIITAESGIQINEASFNISVIDPDFEITGNVYIYLSNKLATIDTKTYGSAESINRVVFTNLIPETEYTIEIKVTIGRTSKSVIKETFTTIAQSSLNIETPEDFFAMSNNRSGNYVLKNDIDFSEVNFVTPFTSSFIGSFEGNGFTLSNITITESRLYNGVFGYISSGSVKNVTIDQLQMGTEETPIQTSSSTKTGFLSGYQASSLSVIENVTITNASMVLSTSSSTYVYVGGIVGEARGRVENVSIQDASISLHTTSNAAVRLGGGIGYGFESLQASKLHVDVDLAYMLEAEITTRTNRSFSIYIGGLLGDVDPQSTNLGAFKEMIYEGNIVLSTIDYNTNANDKANYSLFVGGAFGVINRSFDMIYVNANIDVSIDAIDVVHQVSQTIRVGGFAGLVNTYDVPSHIVLEGGNIRVVYDSTQVQARIEAFIGLSRRVVMEGFILNTITFNGFVGDAMLHLIPLSTLNNFFDSMFLNEQLLGD